MRRDYFDKWFGHLNQNDKSNNIIQKENILRRAISRPDKKWDISIFNAKVTLELFRVVKKSFS